LPRVLDPWSPGQIVALAGKRHAAGREIHTERTADQDDECGAFLALGPSVTFLARRVNAPLDL
jgi:hypothetical protein